jgi:hypothetical protein
MKLPPLRSIVAASVLGLAAAASHAAVSEVVPTLSGDFTVTDTTGAKAPESFDFNVSPTTNPLPVVMYDTNPPTDQSNSSIKTFVATAYDTAPSTLTLASACNNISGGCTGLTTTSTSFKLTGLGAFDFLAIHFGGGELLFHWAQPITEVTLTALDGFPGGLSNYRAYLGVSAVPLPGALALFLGAIGFFGARRKLAQAASSEAMPA